MIKTRSLFRRLAHSRSGIAMTEFALAMPFLLTTGLWGIELANFAVINMKVAQLASHVADNASRIGDTSMLENRAIYEADINDLLAGANRQAGARLDVFGRGRVVISSLEVYNESDHCDADGNCPSTGASEGEQFIHWQRCLGAKNAPSSYGDEGDEMPTGMGDRGHEVIALEGDATIFVEIFYDYDPLVANMFLRDSEIHSVASFTVRSDRDLTKIHQRDPLTPDPVALCSTFSNPFAVAPAT